MFSRVCSFISNVLGNKRSIDTVEGVSDTSAKKQKKEVEYIHKVKVSNLPSSKIALCKKFFSSKGYTRLSKSPTWDYAIITVDNEEDAAKCVADLDGLVFKKKTIHAEQYKVSRDEYAERFQKKNGPQVDHALDKRTPDEKLQDQVTPLWRMPYEKQLNKKHHININHLRKVKRTISSLPDLKFEDQRAWAFASGLPCEILDPIASPIIDGYRTKCEFTVGKNLSGENSVGFLLGLYRDGITSVLEPSSCKNVPDTAKTIARLMNDYINASDLPVYDRVDKTGCWRLIMTKTQRTGDILLLIQIRGVDLTEERLEEEKKNLVDFWNNNEDLKITTLIFQVWDGDSNGLTDKSPLQILTGDGYIYEELLGCRFRLSANSFFQVNTPATELLYSKCAEWCSIDNTKKTTLLDLCCGTGTIGITMAKSVDRVIGIEMVPEAIVDAKANAALNGVTNATYYANKVEDKIDVITKEVNEEVVAVLDPPRNGVHNNVIRAIREASLIDRVVYISCDAKQAAANFTALCRPPSNRFRGMPFKMSRAVSVDLFPHTDHCELMVEFVRVKATEDEA
ncbi:S-adenosyl-L-methionine-dependent methyltransferase [Pilobolus umbonatus]|nr:S-adenosyl-L-methionine-dependent methyltransferase [Pilobolus umbonatus]